MKPAFRAFFSVGIVLLLAASPAFAKKKPAEAPRPTWVIHSGGRVFQRTLTGKSQDGLSDKEKARISAIAREKMSATAMFITANPLSPVSTNNLTPIDID